MEGKRELCALERCGVKRKLSNESQVVLNVHLEILFAKDRTGLLKDLGELARGESMIVIVSDPGLKTTHRVFSKCSAAVDESFADPRDLGDMGVSGRQFSVWKLKPDGSFRGGGESFG